MTRLYVIVEGPTEQAFIRDVLAPHLDARGVYTTPSIVTTRRDRGIGEKLGRGGGNWKHWLNDIRRFTGERSGRDVRFTTLFDLYGLPDDFPELATHGQLPDTAERATRLELAMGLAVNDRRFIPYLQRHEFEALVLACFDALAWLLPDKKAASGLARLRAQIGHLPPEDVNDGPSSAPSKRLLATIPGYKKATHGPQSLELAGLDHIRAACPRFNGWLTQLEQLAPGAAS